jgi:hypothetical protein
MRQKGKSKTLGALRKASKYQQAGVLSQLFSAAPNSSHLAIAGQKQAAVFSMSAARRPVSVDEPSAALRVNQEDLIVSGALIQVVTGALNPGHPVRFRS